MDLLARKPLAQTTLIRQQKASKNFTLQALRTHFEILVTIYAIV